MNDRSDEEYLVERDIEANRDIEVLFETNNNFQNDAKVVEPPRNELRVEMATPTSNKNMIRNHPLA